MASDFDEFFGCIGRDVPVYRTCLECDDCIIVDPEKYGKPKTYCDPGYCEHAIPYCICRDRIMFTVEQVDRECSFPNCSRTPPIPVPDDDDDDDDDDW